MRFGVSTGGQPGRQFHPAQSAHVQELSLYVGSLKHPMAARGMAREVEGVDIVRRALFAQATSLDRNRPQNDEIETTRSFLPCGFCRVLKRSVPTTITIRTGTVPAPVPGPVPGTLELFEFQV